MRLDEWFSHVRALKSQPGADSPQTDHVADTDVSVPLERPDFSVSRAAEDTGAEAHIVSTPRLSTLPKVARAGLSKTAQPTFRSARPGPSPKRSRRLQVSHTPSLAGAETPILRQRGRQETREELLRRLLDPVLSLEEAAQVLGVCTTTVRRYTNRGLLKHHRTSGNQRRFKLSDVLSFMGEPRESDLGGTVTSMTSSMARRSDE
jgi:excisionase family DNA binding protein